MHSVCCLYITSENVSRMDVIILKECQPGPAHNAAVGIINFPIRRWSLEAQPDKQCLIMMVLDVPHIRYDYYIHLFLLLPNYYTKPVVA